MDSFDHVGRDLERARLDNMTQVVDLRVEKLGLGQTECLLAASRSSKTVRRWALWSSELDENTTISSRYTRANCHLTMVKIVSMARWYVAGAFISPNSIRVNTYVPK